MSIRSLDLDWLRRNITLVEQQSVLFNETIYQNVAFGALERNTLSLEDVQKAAEFALLQQTVTDMSHGLDTLVGSSGGSLSGGQTQRVALARARLRDTPILILDESTSALDNISRSLIVDAIRQWRRGKTTIVITHDVSQILPEDYVYVFSQGQIDREGYWKSLEDIISHFNFPVPQNERNDTKCTPKGGRRDDLVLDGSHIPLTNMLATPGLDAIAAGEKSVAAARSRSSIFRRSYVPSLFVDRRDSFSFEGTATRIAPAPPPIVSSFWRVMPSVSRPTRRPSASSDANDTEASALTVTHTTDSVVSSLVPEEYLERTANMAVGARARAMVRRMSRPIGSIQRPQSVGSLPSHTVFNLRRRRNRSRRPDEADSMTKILRTVWPALPWKAKGLLIVGFLGALVHAICTPIFSWIFSNLMETFYLGEDRTGRALRYSLAILGVAAADAVAAYLMVFFLEYCGQVWVNKIRIDAMTRILLQAREFFDAQQDSISRLAESLDRNAEEMRNLVGRFAGFVFVAIVLMLTSLVWCLIVCWKLTLVGIATAPVLYGITYCFQAVSGVLESQCNTASEAAASIFTETLSSIKTVRVLTLEGYFLEKYSKATAKVLRVGLRRAAYSGVFYGISDSAIIFVTALLLFYGAVLVSSAQFAVPQVLEVFTLLLFTMSNVNAIVAFIPQIGSSSDTATRLLRLANLPVATHESVGTIRIAEIGDIVMEEVSFSYPTRADQAVLHNFGLKIPAGAAVAIVGSSGSGKSTVASLLLKLYQAETNGFGAGCRISIAGLELKDIHTSTLRSLTAIVSQKPVLFPGTIAENISYGLSESSPYATLASIRSAAKEVGIDEFIMSLPSGYSTVIGEGGTGLSGGQAQRIAIARALVRRPNILILDEATSALDLESAAIIRDSIQTFIRKQRRKTDSEDSSDGPVTVIIITHSRDMMEIADHIVMLDQGSVVEQGDFDTLLRRNGSFSKLLNGGEWG